MAEGILYYDVSTEILEQQFEALKSAGIIPMEVNIEHFLSVTSDVLPPGHPDPCNKRGQDPE